MSKTGPVDLPPLLGVGIKVRIRSPFDRQYPATYVIESRSETGAWKISGGVDFDETYLEIIR